MTGCSSEPNDGVKLAKRTLLDSTRADGSSDWDKVLQAGLEGPPAMLLFGRRVRDLLPIQPGKPNMAESWIECTETREVTTKNLEWTQ